MNPFNTDIGILIDLNNSIQSFTKYPYVEISNVISGKDKET